MGLTEVDKMPPWEWRKMVDGRTRPLLSAVGQGSTRAQALTEPLVSAIR